MLLNHLGVESEVTTEIETPAMPVAPTTPTYRVTLTDLVMAALTGLEATGPGPQPRDEETTPSAPATTERHVDAA